MGTLSSVSDPTLTFKLFAEVVKDVSARPSWLTTASGIDSYPWQTKNYTGPENDLSENSLNPPKDYLKFKSLPKPVNVFTPKTELASRLWEIRKRIIASGEPLLDWDGVQKEVSQRRAEREGI